MKDNYKKVTLTYKEDVYLTILDEANKRDMAVAAYIKQAVYSYMHQEKALQVLSTIANIESLNDIGNSKEK